MSAVTSSTAEPVRDRYWAAALSWALAVGFIYTALAVTQGSPVQVALAYNAAGIGAVVAGVIASRRTRSGVFLWLTLGIACWALGDVVWDSWALRYGEAPYPSLIEIFFFAYFPFMAFGLLRIRRYTGVLHRRIWGFLVAAIAAGWLALGAVLVSQQEATTLAQVTAVALVAGDAAMLALYSFAVLQRPWPVPRWLPYLFAALALFAAGDMLYGYSSTTGAFDAGGLADFLMVGGTLFFTLSVLHPDSVGSLGDDA